MKTSAPLFAAALLLALPAGAALGSVDDQAAALSPDARAALEQDLSQLPGNHHFDVVLLDHAPGNFSGYTTDLFNQHHLGSRDGLIAIGVQDHKVDVHLGSGFTQHGVGSSEIRSHIQSDFLPQARAGHLDVASENLAHGLLGATTSAPSNSYHGGSYPVAQHHHSFPWGGLLLFLAIGGAIWWVWRQNSGAPRDLKPRVAALKAAHAKVVSQALRLDEVDTLGRFRDGAIAKEYQTLGKRSADLMTESRDFGESVLEAEDLVKRNKLKDALPLVERLESRVTGLGSEVAGALTVLDRLEGTSGLTGDERDLPKLIQRLNRRLQELKQAYADLRRRAPHGYDQDSTVESRFRECDELLTSVPVDAKESERAVMDATDALDAYRRSVDGENDRVAVRQGEMNGWASSGSYLPYVNVPIGYQRPYFYSTYYEPPVVIYEDNSGWANAGGGWFGNDAAGADAGGSWGDDTRRDAGWGWGSDSSSGSDGGGSWGDSGGSDWGGDSGGGSWGDSGGGGDW